ncbi:hypothetical protein [Baaleninema simplex]|nr:hypothetical protein [Baaleninema simplex]
MKKSNDRILSFASWASGLRMASIAILALAMSWGVAQDLSMVR